jgi:hypothetical protein
MARKGCPDSRDRREKRGIQAKLVTGGTQATPDERVTRAIREIRDKRVIREIRDKRATPAIEASPLHALTDSTALLILATEA